MAPVAGFSEVLAQFVDRYESGETAAPRRWHPGIATRPLFPFEVPGPVLRRDHATARAEDCPAAAPPEPRRAPKRRLTIRQDRALHHLVTLGAKLSPDFTREELRSAFRALARAFHPDRHPGIDDVEKARLSAAFTEMRSHYELLKILD
jgi:hypothetical protein